MEKLHPGARWIFRVRAYSLFFVPIIFLIVFGFSFLKMLSEILFSGVFIIAFGSMIFLLIIFGEIYSRMAYNRWFYEFTKRELKIESGIIFKKYRSIPYQRIQNAEIHRGIIARMFGFSTLEIHTAGYSGMHSRYGRAKAEGHIPAVSIIAAEKIREFVMDKIARSKGQGL